MQTVALSVVLRFWLRCRQWLYQLCYVFGLDADSGFTSCATFLPEILTVALSVVLSFCLRCWQRLYQSCYVFVADADNGFISCATFLF